MTSISATSYTSYYPTTTTTAARTAAGTSTGSGSTATGATNITLSDAALAAMNQPDFATVVAQARAALDALVANGTKPADANLSGLDRRQLFAVATNAQGKFTPDEQAAARAEQQSRLDAALAGPLAVAHVTDDIEGIYTAAQTWLDGASDEEKATATWQSQKAALTEAQSQLAADPSSTPSVDGDIVADYIRRADTGETSASRDFSQVASDARAALDAQYASAKSAGKLLTFFPGDTSGQPVDFSTFDSRSLAAVALNQNGKFSTEEVFAAKQQITSRSNAAVLASLQNAGSDPGAFAKNLVSAYASMTPEERQAAGWSDKLYAAAVASYNTSSKLASMFGTSSGSSNALTLLGGGASSSSNSAASLLSDGTSSLASFLDSADGSGTGSDGSMSLANFLAGSGS